VYLTARTELTFEPEYFQAVKPAVNLRQRVEKFNENDRGLKMKMVSISFMSTRCRRLL